MPQSALSDATKGWCAQICKKAMSELGLITLVNNRPNDWAASHSAHENVIFGRYALLPDGIGPGDPLGQLETRIFDHSHTLCVRDAHQRVRSECTRESSPPAWARRRPFLHRARKGPATNRLCALALFNERLQTILPDKICVFGRTSAGRFNRESSSKQRAEFDRWLSYYRELVSFLPNDLDMTRIEANAPPRDHRESGV